jgi:1-acyl-sn-glycerol-3-phosphate acyltransferase
MKLSGQEYVDMYATAAKRQIADAAKAEAKAEKEARAGKEAAEKEAREDKGGGTERPAS